MEQLSDDINSLQTDNTGLSRSELVFIDTFLTEKSSMYQKAYEQLKQVVVLTILFCLLSLPALDNLIIKYFPSLSSDLVRIVVKGVILGILFFIIKNWGLVRIN